MGRLHCRENRQLNYLLRTYETINVLGQFLHHHCLTVVVDYARPTRHTFPAEISGRAVEGKAVSTPLSISPSGQADRPAWLIAPTAPESCEKIHQQGSASSPSKGALIV